MCIRHIDEKLRGRLHPHIPCDVSAGIAIRDARETLSLHQPSIVRAEKLIEL